MKTNSKPIDFQYNKGMSSSGREVGKAYVNFVRNTTEQLRQKVSDELWVINLFEVILSKRFYQNNSISY